jgi:hypothetical protein
MMTKFLTRTRMNLGGMVGGMPSVIPKLKQPIKLRKAHRLER